VLSGFSQLDLTDAFEALGTCQVAKMPSPTSVPSVVRGNRTTSVFRCCSSLGIKTVRSRSTRKMGSYRVNAIFHSKFRQLPLRGVFFQQPPDFARLFTDWRQLLRKEVIMAILVTNGSRFCRFCGGETTRRDGFTWCENRPDEACEQRGRADRLYCERCGSESPTGVWCGHCRQVALVP